MSDDKERPDLANVHRRIDEAHDQISTLANLQAKTETQLLSLAESMAKGFADSREEAKETRSEIRSIVQRINKPSSPPNWPAIISSVVIVGGAMVSFVLLLNSHLATEGVRRDAKLLQLEERVETYLEKAHAAELKSHKELSAAELETWKSLSRLEGRHDMLIKRIEDVDNIGS